MKNKKVKLEMALTMSLILFVFILSSCNRFKSGYSGQITDKKGTPLKGVTLYAIRDGKTDTNLIHALSPEELALFNGEKDLSPYFSETTDADGKFSAEVELEKLRSLQKLYLLFRKSGYKSIMINMTEGSHNNMDIKLDSIGGN